VTPTYAVVPSAGRECLDGCLNHLLPQVDTLFLIRTEEFGLPDIDTDKLSFITDTASPRNISRWWNLGITAAASYAKAFRQEEWNVLIVNDDVLAGANLTEYLDHGLRSMNSDAGGPPPGARPVLAYPDNYPPYGRTEFHTAPGQVQLSTRISGWCFMLRGEVNLLADEQFQWHFGDDDLDWRAREQGGAVMVPFCPVKHLHPNESTEASPELTARTHVDRQLFYDKWSVLPL
jgi:GT2 family glycosyltransferase